MKTRVDLVWDSGAFSAWRKGIRLNLKKYMNHLERFESISEGYVGMDVIPGNPGMPRTPQQTEESASAGWKNHMAMRKAGFEPIPVYHFGERRYWLEKMLGEGFKYIGIGGVARAAAGCRKEWLDGLFGYLGGDKGYPDVKVHGFGMTSVPLMFRYPWFSCDSMSYQLMSAYGWILVPKLLPDGSYDYTRTWYQMGVSKGSSRGEGGIHGQVLKTGNHISLVGKRQRDHVIGWLESQGFDIEQAATSDKVRTAINLRFFRMAEKTYKPAPFFYRRQGLWCEQSGHGRRTPVGEFRILYTLNICRILSDVLEDEGVRNRLMSYFYFVDSDPFDIKEYVRTGRFPNIKRRVRLEK